MSKFEVWEAHLEQWDENNIDPPDRIIEARDLTQAAELFADLQNASGSEIAVIVRDESGNYFEIELFQTWELDMFKPTTLKELCVPCGDTQQQGNLP
jgi:hypothetical protein